jgi:hypothetical protein
MYKKIFYDEKFYYKVFYLENPLDLLRPVREIYFSTRIRGLGIKAPVIVGKSICFRNFKLIVTLKFERLYNFKTLGQKGEEIKKEELEKYCQQAFELMSILHNNNIRHGDLTARNFFVIDNKVGICDFETMRKVPLGIMAMKESHHFLKYCRIHLGRVKSAKLYRNYLNSVKSYRLFKILVKKHVYCKLNYKREQLSKNHVIA